MDATIAALRERLALAGRIVDAGPDHITVDVRVERPGAPARHRQLDVSFGRRQGRPWFVATAAVGPARDYDASAALTENGALAFGALGVLGDLLVARTAGPLDAVDADVLRALASLADGARGLASRPEHVASLFTHYV